MGYRSEIRPSEISGLKEKVSKSNYSKYLRALTINKCRALEDQKISFDFPVTALIGTNGSGKTTVLGASAVLYKSVAPRTFFTRNRQLDKGMQDWSITYEAIDKSQATNDIVKRTARFNKEKWTRKALDRSVVFFGISRTLPAVERKNLSRFADKRVNIQANEIKTLSAQSIAHISSVLGKDVNNYHVIQSQQLKNEKLLSGTTSSTEYSEFHFGAGESSIIKMISAIDEAEDHSLILIEEIENGLHPLAILKLIDYLIKIAEEKKLQIIFTTHSEYAIRNLPEEAVWAIYNGRVFQGKPDIESSMALRGDVDCKLGIYVEDEFAKEWILSMLRNKGFSIEAIEFFAMGGDGTALEMNKSHNLDPGRQYPSICILDGDSRHNEEAKVFKLPGDAPERYIFEKVYNSLDSSIIALSDRLGFGSSEDELSVLRNAIDDVRRSNFDHHLIFDQIGEKLDCLDAQIVKNAFLNVWKMHYEDDVNDFLLKIQPYLPKKRRD